MAAFCYRGLFVIARQGSGRLYSIVLNVFGRISGHISDGPGDLGTMSFALSTAVAFKIVAGSAVK
jgi:hypothetical protein